MSTQRRRVLEGSGLIDGVYIEGLDGKAYTVDDWKGGNDANSIIVASGDVKFRMALTQASDAMKISRNYNDPLENYMTGTASSATALSDYDGACNTAKIMQMLPSTNYAAGYCNAFTFPDGKTKGYLPSLGQLWLANQNKEAITTALSACGGTEVDCIKYLYWSSTFWGVSGKIRMNWEINWCNGQVVAAFLSGVQYVRPFADIS